MVNPAYYLSVDPRGFNMQYFLDTFRNQFDPSRGTRIPHFDLRGKQYPATLGDLEDWDRVERRCLCGPTRILWDQICDVLDRELTTKELCREDPRSVWLHGRTARMELEAQFGSLDDQLWYCVLGYIGDIVGMTITFKDGVFTPRPESPPPVFITRPKQRRSRRKDTFMEQYVQKGMLSDSLEDGLSVLDVLDEDIQLYPSDLDDGLI